MISVLLVSMALVTAANPALAELNAADVAAWTAFYEAANGGGTQTLQTLLRASQTGFVVKPSMFESASMIRATRIHHSLSASGSLNATQRKSE